MESPEHWHCRAAGRTREKQRDCAIWTSKPPDALEHPEAQQNPSNATANWRCAKLRITSRLSCEGCPHLEADVLGETIERDMIRYYQQHSFRIVGLRPGNILVAKEFGGLVDWEYTGQSSAGVEPGTLALGRHVLLLSSITPVNQAILPGSHFLHMDESSSALLSSNIWTSLGVSTRRY